MDAAVKTFFSNPRFAVAGASSDPSKFGHKVFAWYLTHSLPVTPLNPKSPTISVLKKDYTTVASPTSLPHASETSLSIITPPFVTKQLLKEAKEAGIRAVWLQPGTFDKEVWEQAKGDFEAVVGGTEDGPGGEDGWCVLVDGEWGLGLAGKKGGKL